MDGPGSLKNLKPRLSSPPPADSHWVGGEEEQRELPPHVLAGLDFSSLTLLLSLVLIVVATIMIINQVAKIMGVPASVHVGFLSHPPSPICQGVELQGGTLRSAFLVGSICGEGRPQTGPRTGHLEAFAPFSITSDNKVILG